MRTVGIVMLSGLLSGERKNEKNLNDHVFRLSSTHRPYDAQVDFVFLPFLILFLVSWFNNTSPFYQHPLMKGKVHNQSTH